MEKAKLIELLYKYRVDFSNSGLYTDFGIREEDFEDLAKDIIELSKEI